MSWIMDVIEQYLSMVARMDSIFIMLSDGR